MAKKKDKKVKTAAELAEEAAHKKVNACKQLGTTAIGKTDKARQTMRNAQKALKKSAKAKAAAEAWAKNRGMRNPKLDAEADKLALKAGQMFTDAYGTSHEAAKANTATAALQAEIKADNIEKHLEHNRSYLEQAGQLGTMLDVLSNARSLAERIREQAVDMSRPDGGSDNIEPEVYFDEFETGHMFDLDRLLSDIPMTLPGDLSADSDIEAILGHIGPATARVLIDMFYSQSKVRIASENRIRAVWQNFDESETRVLQKFYDVSSANELLIKAAIGKYVATHEMEPWLMEQTGIGTVLAGGLMAHFNIEKAPRDANMHSFAGLGEKCVCVKGERRPWNAFLKSLCAYKIGESFVKNPRSFYGEWFVKRKAAEVVWNDCGGSGNKHKSRHGVGTGMNTMEAAIRDATDIYKTPEGDRVGKYKPNTAAWPWVNACYPKGTCGQIIQIKTLTEREAFLAKIRLDPGKGFPMLPPAHIHARARRWVVKLFISHLHEVWWWTHFKTKPLCSYVFCGSFPEHSHKIEPPPGREGWTWLPPLYRSDAA